MSFFEHYSVLMDSRLGGNDFCTVPNIDFYLIIAGNEIILLYISKKKFDFASSHSDLHIDR